MKDLLKLLVLILILFMLYLLKKDIDMLYFRINKYESKIIELQYKNVIIEQYLINLSTPKYKDKK